MKSRRFSYVSCLLRFGVATFALFALYFLCLQIDHPGASEYSPKFKPEDYHVAVEEVRPKNGTDCLCTDEDGRSVNMCYTLPDNPKIRGKKFNCDYVQPLRHLELINHTPSLMEDDLLDFMVVVTAASSEYYHHIIRLIHRMRKVYPSAKLIVYNLGFTAQQLSDLYSICGLEIRNFPFEKYEDHIRFLEQYRWKPIVIADALRDFDAIWYMDASIVPKRGHFDKVPDLIRCRDRILFDRGPIPSIEVRDGRESIERIPSGFDETQHQKNVQDCQKYPYLLHSYTGHGIFAATAPGMYDFLPSNLLELRKKKAKMFEAGLVYVVKRDEVINDILKWYVLCALEKECMAPTGAFPACFFEDQDRFKDYAHCHRYDQSALNILLANTNYYDRHYYTSDIVDFFRIEREVDEDEDIDLSTLSCTKPIIVNNNI